MRCFSVKKSTLASEIDFTPYPNNFAIGSNNIRSIVGIDYEAGLGWDIYDLISKIKSREDRNMFLYGTVVFKLHSAPSTYIPDSCFLLEIDSTLQQPAKDLFDESLPVAFHRNLSLWLCFAEHTCIRIGYPDIMLINENGRPISCRPSDDLKFKALSAHNRERQMNSHVLSF